MSPGWTVRPVVTRGRDAGGRRAALEEVDRGDAGGPGRDRGGHRGHRMMGGAYGRRVMVVAGKGNNGADGRVAAARPGRSWGPCLGGRRPTPRPRPDRFVRPGHRRRLRHRLPGDLRATAVAAGRSRARRRHSLGGRRRHRRGLRAPVGGRPDGDVRRAQGRTAPGRRRPAGRRRSRWPTSGSPSTGPCRRRRRGRRRGPPARPSAPGRTSGQRAVRGGRLARNGGGGRSLRRRRRRRAGAGMVRLAVPGAEPVGPGGWPPEAVRVRAARDDVGAEELGRSSAVAGPWWSVRASAAEPAVHAQVRDWSPTPRYRWWPTPTRWWRSARRTPIGRDEPRPCGPARAHPPRRGVPHARRRGAGRGPDRCRTRAG